MMLQFYNFVSEESSIVSSSTDWLKNKSFKNTESFKSNSRQLFTETKQNKGTSFIQITSFKYKML